MEFELKDLKKEYEKFREKYKLPKFEELNQDFYIEKIEQESDVLLKHIRKIMMEKVVNSLSFLEMLLNPMNLPRMYMVYVNSMSEAEVKLIGEIYSKFSELIIFSLEREIDYDEKKEAELINEINRVWNKNKEGLNKILMNIRKPVNNENKEKKTKSYFG